MNDDKWALWIYQADITNGAGGAGDQTYTLTVGVGNELEVLYVRVLQGDPTSRLVLAQIDDGTNQGPRLIGGSTAQDTFRQWPTAGSSADDGVLGSARLLMAGAMRLIVTIQAVALSENTACWIGCRIRSGVPTVVESGASTPTININSEAVF